MKTVPMGRALVRAGIVTHEQVTDAVEAQRREGGLLGQHLILAGAVTRQDMYAVLAKQWRAPIVDLLAEPPDPGLFDGEPYDAISRGWVPWRREGEVVIVATSVPPTGERLLNMRTATGASTVVLRAATDWDVFQAVTLLRRGQVGEIVEPAPLDRGVVVPSRSDRVLRRLTWPAVFLAAIAAGVMSSPQWTLAILLAAANTLFLASVVFTVVTAVKGALVRGSRSRGYLDQNYRHLPAYTVLVPSTGSVDETATLLDHLEGMAYPKSKLEIMVLLDEDDSATFESLKALGRANYVKLVRVPRATWTSRSSTCNYGLALARGSLVVFYRPTDRPEPAQLLEATDLLTGGGRADRPDTVASLVCVQAGARYTNVERNLLTRMTTVEREAWSGGMLPALDAWGLPTPLGGPSQHYLTRDLRALGGWDADDLSDGSDLSMRVAADDRRVAVMSSITRERAHPDLDSWMGERVQWISRCLLTVAIVPRGRKRSVTLALMSVVQLVANPLAFVTFPLAIVVGAVTVLVTRSGLMAAPSALVTAELTWLTLGTVVVAALAGLAAGRAYGWKVGLYALCAPISWCLQTWAVARAGVALLVRPTRQRWSRS